MAHAPAEIPSAKTETKPHHLILSYTQTAAFFEDITFEFADGRNYLLGPSGAGKTLLMEMIRFALGQEPRAEADREQARRFESYVKTNLGGGLARLSIRTKHGATYTVERAWGEPSRVLDENRRPVPAAFGTDVLFRADLYSQHEIVEIADDPRRQLRLLDKFVDRALLDRVAAEIKKVQLRLQENADRLRALADEIHDFAEDVDELPVLAEKLKAYAAGDADGKKLDDAHRRKALRDKERKALLAIREETGRARHDLELASASISRRLTGRVDPEILQGSNADLVEPLSRELASLNEEQEAFRAAFAKRCDAIGALLDEKEPLLSVRHAEQETAYQAVLEQSKEERSHAAERAADQAKFDEITARKRDLESRTRERSVLLEDRKRLLARLSELRDERYRARKTAADALKRSLAAAGVEVDVRQDGDNTRFQTLLADALKAKGSSPSSTVKRLAEEYRPADLARALEKGDPEAIARNARVTLATAERLIQRLGSLERVHEIETAELDDLPIISLRVGGDRKEISFLSTGQRCTAVLPILLLDSDSPLLIDQPEDNLDSAFIFTTVVESIVATKGRRQLLFASHNANIVTLGDPTRLFVLDADASRSRTPVVGTLAEITQDVELRVEGGRLAFLKRKDLYGVK